jgi:lipopolysaccharide transport system permease protein
MRAGARDRLLSMNETLTVIEPQTGWGWPRLGEAWEHRELLWALARRDIQVRYKQTLLGIVWTVLEPLAIMAIFAVVFGRLAGLPSDGAPYTLFALAGLVPWTYFSHALGESASSLVEHRNVLTRVWFPRILLPASPLVSGLVDVATMLAILVVAVLAKAGAPGPTALLAPAFVLVAALAALGAGLWLSVLNALYRDFRYVLPFLLQLWFFATPVAWPASLVADPRARALLGLNPVAGAVEGMRWALLGTAPQPAIFLVSAASALLLVGSGLVFFRRMERVFVDAV